jgi:hypothetical protein
MIFRAPDSKPKHNAAQHRMQPTGFALLRSPCQRLTPAVKLDFNRKSSDHKDSPASLFVGAKSELRIDLMSEGHIKSWLSALEEDRGMVLHLIQTHLLF